MKLSVRKDPDFIAKIWDKGGVIDDLDPARWRSDYLGNVIYFFDYLKKTPAGWEVTHIMPVSEGGTDEIENLRPIWWLFRSPQKSLF